MGMAASQARLLTITARIHDVEQQAQSIQNAKIQLATQSDQVYQDYLAALDATTLTVKDYEGNRIVANFDNLSGPHAVLNASGKNYIFRDSENKIIVPDEILDAYEQFTEEFSVGGDPYRFALWMAAGQPNDMEDFDAAEESIRESLATNCENSTLASIQKQMDKIKKDVCEIATVDTKPEDITGSAYIEGLADPDDNNYETIINYAEQYANLEMRFNNAFFKSYRDDIYEQSTGESAEKIDDNEFNYYVRMFQAISAEGGRCTAISDYNGILDVDASKDGEWLQNMLKSGRITIDELSLDKTTGDAVFASTGVSTDSSLEYTTTSSIDKAALAKAEAEYEHKTKELDAKDKKFDMDLSKLETERNALTTEYDSVKKVISDNIERTFGIFS